MVKCDMRQLDDKGNLMFPAVQEITRKVPLKIMLKGLVSQEL
jgi:hypothetical protein